MQMNDFFKVLFKSYNKAENLDKNNNFRQQLLLLDKRVEVSAAEMIAKLYAYLDAQAANLREQCAGEILQELKGYILSNSGQTRLVFQATFNYFRKEVKKSLAHNIDVSFDKLAIFPAKALILPKMLP